MKHLLHNNLIYFSQLFVFQDRAVHNTIEKPSFIPLQAITGRKNPSFKVSQRQIEKKHDEVKESNNKCEQKSSENNAQCPLETSKPPRVQRRSRLAAKFYNNH